MINRNFHKREDYRDDGHSENRIPAFQLNKFQSEFNLSFNKEMAGIIVDALQRNEEIVQNSGKNVPTCLYALLTKLEDFKKPRYYDDSYDNSESYERRNDEKDSYEYR